MIPDQKFQFVTEMVVKWKIKVLFFHFPEHKYINFSISTSIHNDKNNFFQPLNCLYFKFILNDN